MWRIVVATALLAASMPALAQDAEVPLLGYAGLCSKLIFPPPKVLDCMGGAAISDKHVSWAKNRAETSLALSRLRMYYPTGADGKPDRDRYLALLCRTAGKDRYGQILAIHANRRTGTTCW